jgi:hypothetical protein
MSYTTVEVELDHGRVWPRGAVTLPAKARALLTVLEPDGGTPAAGTSRADAGLKHFLSAPDFALTAEQFRASMEADLFEQ